MPTPRLHPLTRSTRVDKLNALLRKAWDKGLLPPPDLSPDALWNAGSGKFGPADETGGRSDADVADFRARLTNLCDSLANEAQLNETGRIFAWGQITSAIKQRHALGRLWREKPQMAATRIAPPIIVLGQMRSGTTRVQRLLAADPAHRATRFCDALDPVPATPDLRPAKAAAILKALGLLNPWMQAIHPTSATRTDEELGWLASSLGHSTFWAQWRVPGFTRFAEKRDPGPLYAEFARIFRTDAAHHGNAESKRVLKVPQFCDHPGKLLDTFPDALVVHCERNTDEVARSTVSLIANQMGMQSDCADLDWINAEVHRKIALREQRVADALAQFKGPVARVHFDALGQDWKAAMHAIYASHGRIPSEAAIAAMGRETQRSAGGAHRAHARQLDGFEK